MDYIVPILLFFFSGLYWAYWFVNRRRENGFREDLTDTAIGQLTGETVQRKASGRSFSGQTHKKTTVTYTYHVADVAYTCECVVWDRFQAMPASTRVIYQRKQPKMSYLPDFEKPDKTGMQHLALGGAVFFMLMGFLYAFGMI